VVGVAGTVADAKALAHERMDVVLMDYRLPDGTGAEATRFIKNRWPTARIVMLTAVQDDETLLESIQAGADGYLTKDRAVADVVAAVRSARAGETLLPRSVIVGIAQRVAGAQDRQPERPPMDPLTARELDVMRALADASRRRTSAIDWSSRATRSEPMSRTSCPSWMCIRSWRP